MAPGAVETKLVQVAFASAVYIVARTGQGGDQARGLSRRGRRLGERRRIGEPPGIAIPGRLPDVPG